MTRFPDLGPEIKRTALTYDQALGPVVLDLQQLFERTAKTVANRHWQGVAQTLVLSQMLKGLSLNKASRAAAAQYVERRDV